MKGIETIDPQGRQRTVSTDDKNTPDKLDSRDKRAGAITSV